ncbi:right-handed parallel beta-helix repeat-containing protein [Saliphagus sp. GCM10025334]
MSDCRVIDTPGHYTLENDINTSDSSNCVKITTGGVTFDGNGHVITYTGGNSGPSAISASSGSNVVVQDVTIRYFSTGVRFYDVDNGEISDVTVEPESSDNYPGSYGNGITLLSDSNYNLVQNNVIDKPGEWGDAGTTGSGIYVVDSHHNELIANDVYNPSDVGIQLDGSQANNLTDNQIWANQWDTQRTVRSGIRLDSDSNETVLQRNYVYGQSSSQTQALQDGIYVASERNTLTANYVQSAHYSGIVVYGDGNELDSNTATGNVEHGFEIKSGDIELMNNVATGNSLSGIYIDGTTFGTVLNNTASGNSNWDVTLVDTAGLDADNTALSSGGPGVTVSAIDASIKGVGSKPVPDGMDHVGQFVEVDGSPSLEISYTDAAATGVDEDNLSLWYYDDSSWSHSGGSVDTAANVVSGTTTSGIYAPLSNDTLAPTISNFEATSPADGELHVSFDSTESLDALEVTISNESGTAETLAFGDFTETEYNNFTYTADRSIEPGAYNVTLESAADAAGNDGANGHTDDAFVTGPLEIPAVQAIGERGTDIVNDGDAVEVRATVVGYGIESVTVDASVLGAGSVKLTDSNDDGVYNGSFTVDAYSLGDGRKWIDVTAIDGSGKTVSNDSAWLDLDTSNPSIENSYAVDNGDGDDVVSHGDEVKVVVALSDFSGLETVVASPNDLGAKPTTLEEIDEGFYDTFEGMFTVDAANATYDGTKRISIQAADRAGNHVWFTVPIILDTSDVDPPTLVGATATNLDGTNNSVGDGDRINVSVNATDALGVDAVTADASDFGAGDVTLVDSDGDNVYEATFTVDTQNASPDGTYGIDIQATDMRGKRSTVTTNELTLETPRDLAAPVITGVTVSDPFDDQIITDGDTVTVRATVTDDKTGVSLVQLNASAFGAGTVELENVTDGDVYEGTFTVDTAQAASDGYQSLPIHAEDGDGNAATEWLSLELDRSIASDVTPPTINEFDVTVGSGDSVFVTVNASERLTVLDVAIRNESGTIVSRLTEIGVDFDSGSYGNSYRYFGHYPDPADGTYEVTLESAVDLAGNEGANSETGTVIIDSSDDGDGGTGDDDTNDTLTVTGQLTESDGTTPAAGDWILLVDEETLQPVSDTISDGTGSFSLTAPKGPTYWAIYIQMNESGSLGPVDGSPDLFTVESVDDNATITRTLPAAYETSLTAIRSDTGDPVSNATASMGHEEASLLGLFSGLTDEEGQFAVGTGSQPDRGFEVGGTLHVRVEPPLGTNLETNVTSFDVTGPTDAVVVLNAIDSGEPQPDITVVPPTLDFGTQTVGDNELRTVTVENEGNATLSVTDIGLAGATRHFDVVSPVSFTLAPGDSRDVTVAFEPTSSGTKTATFEISSDDPGEPTVTVALAGSGFSPSTPDPIEGSNDAPVAADDAYTVVEGQTLSVSAPGVLENAHDPDGDELDVTIVEQTQNGTLNVDADGSFTYAPDDGFVGMDSFDYEIKDEYGDPSETATATIEVTLAGSGDDGADDETNDDSESDTDTGSDTDTESDADTDSSDPPDGDGPDDGTDDTNSDQNHSGTDDPENGTGANDDSQSNEDDDSTDDADTVPGFGATGALIAVIATLALVGANRRTGRNEPRR